MLDKNTMDRAAIMGQINRTNAVKQVEQSGDADQVIGASVLFPAWTPRQFAVGDTVIWDGQPTTCTAAYDGALHPDWTPAGYPAGWKAWHGRTPETALRYLMRNAQDKYMAGEYAIWGDEDHPDATYRCKVDNTTHNPGEYAPAWERWEAPTDAEPTYGGSDPSAEDGGESGGTPDPYADAPNWTPWDGINAHLVSKGELRRHNGHVWRSTASNNHWEPGTTGAPWEQVS